MHLASALQCLAKCPDPPHRKHAPTLISAFLFAEASMDANAWHFSTVWAPLQAAHFGELDAPEVAPPTPEVAFGAAATLTFCVVFLVGNASAPVADTFAWGTFFAAPD